MQSNQPIMHSQAPSPREIAQTKYKGSRTNLLLVTAFSLINIIMAAMGSGSYMLFSAQIPYVIAYMGRIFLDEYSSRALFGVMIALAVILTVPYIIFWIFSKKHFGWMVAALVYFSLDFLMFLYFALTNFDPGFLLDLFFHAWVMIYLIMGVKHGKTLRNLPEDNLNEAYPATDTIFGAETESKEPQNSSAIRPAEDVKHKKHAEADAFGYHIIYRKVGKRDELVIGGYIYAEHNYESWVAQPHTMTAFLNGVKISVGFYQGQNFIRVNGTEFAKTTRWL